MTDISRKMLVISMLLFLVCVYLGACGNNQKDYLVDGSTNGVRIGMSAAPRSLDPRIATDVASARVQQLVFNSLIKLNKQSEIVPDLAESWEMPDETIYRFTLRNGVKFHNGKTLTTKDVKATFDAMLSDALASPRKAAYDKLAEITIVDDRIIEFKTVQPYAPFLINLVQGILPEEEAVNLDPKKPVKPIGTGPFQIKEEYGDERIVLSAFDDHFNGRPILDWLEFRVVPDDSIRVMELEKGSLDFVQNDIPANSLKRLAKRPNLEVLSEPGTSYYYIGFNFRLKDHPTLHRRVRRALALAIDRDEIIQHHLGGYAEKATGVLPENHWAYDTSIEQVPYDLEKARELLDNSGFKEVDGKRFEIEFKVSQNKNSIQLAEIIQAQWGKIGVKVNLKALEWGTFYEDIVNGNFETYIMSWVGVTDPDIYYSLFHSTSIPPNGRNRGHYFNRNMNMLLDHQQTDFDQERRQKIYKKIHGIMAMDLPYISLWHAHNVVVKKKDLTGFEFYPAGDLVSFSRVSWASRSTDTGE
ncbi:MAG: ABC transporter substrate-binding protein [bacterium]